ncbi:hypothetical protein C7M84_013223 [Penaeus vannamei]|uniref:Uncharacterized protein n=1 Tax=Penaeus vannamei TaxID=6689 RepID=A0A423SWG6_PENVA|nr:hypothetical protein C7M84_013223 [Penaeus vannamei]
MGTQTPTEFTLRSLTNAIIRLTSLSLSISSTLTLSNFSAFSLSPILTSNSSRHLHLVSSLYLSYIFPLSNFLGSSLFTRPPSFEFLSFSLSPPLHRPLSNFSRSLSLPLSLPLFRISLVSLSPLISLRLFRSSLVLHSLSLFPLSNFSRVSLSLSLNCSPAFEFFVLSLSLLSSLSRISSRSLSLVSSSLSLSSGICCIRSRLPRLSLSLLLFFFGKFSPFASSFPFFTFSSRPSFELSLFVLFQSFSLSRSYLFSGNFPLVLSLLRSLPLPLSNFSHSFSASLSSPPLSNCFFRSLLISRYFSPFPLFSPLSFWVIFLLRSLSSLLLLLLASGISPSFSLSSSYSLPSRSIFFSFASRCSLLSPSLEFLSFSLSLFFLSPLSGIFWLGLYSPCPELIEFLSGSLFSSLSPLSFLSPWVFSLSSSSSPSFGIFLVVPLPLCSLPLFGEFLLRFSSSLSLLSKFPLGVSSLLCLWGLSLIFRFLSSPLLSCLSLVSSFRHFLLRSLPFYFSLFREFSRVFSLSLALSLFREISLVLLSLLSPLSGEFSLGFSLALPQSLSPHLPFFSGNFFRSSLSFSSLPLIGNFSSVLVLSLLPSYRKFFLRFPLLSPSPFFGFFSRSLVPSLSPLSLFFDIFSRSSSLSLTWLLPLFRIFSVLLSLSLLSPSFEFLSFSLSSPLSLFEFLQLGPPRFLSLSSPLSLFRFSLVLLLSLVSLLFRDFFSRSLLSLPLLSPSFRILSVSHLSLSTLPLRISLVVSLSSATSLPLSKSSLVLVSLSPSPLSNFCSFLSRLSSLPLSNFFSFLSLSLCSPTSFPPISLRFSLSSLLSPLSNFCSFCSLYPLLLFRNFFQFSLCSLSPFLDFSRSLSLSPLSLFRISLVLSLSLYSHRAPFEFLSVSLSLFSPLSNFLSLLSLLSRLSLFRIFSRIFSSLSFSPLSNFLAFSSLLLSLPLSIFSRFSLCSSLLLEFLFRFSSLSYLSLFRYLFLSLSPSSLPYSLVLLLASFRTFSLSLSPLSLFRISLVLSLFLSLLLR